MSDYEHPQIRDIPLVETFAAEAGQTVFSVSFIIFAADELRVTVDGVAFDIVTDYTVSGVQDPYGATATLTTPLSGGETVVLYREPELVRLTDFYPEQPATRDSFLNTELDRLMSNCRVLAARGLPAGGAPAQVLQKNGPEDYNIIWGDGSGLVVDPQIASEVPFTPVGSLAADDVQAALAELDAEKSPIGHTHAGVYEPAFAKLTGFNLNLGVVAGTVAEGDHTHAALYTPLAHASDTDNPHGVTKAHLGLPNVQDILDNFTADADPGPTNDASEGYSIGSRWINHTADPKTTWMAHDVTVDAAEWALIGSSGAAGNPAGSPSYVQYNIGGLFSAESSFRYDPDNNMLLTDQEIRDATYPFATGNITGATTTCAFNFKQIVELTVTGDITAPLALPTQVKQISASSYTAATAYYVYRVIVIKQGGTARTIPATFFDNYTLEGEVTLPPAVANTRVEYLARGVWNGTTWTWTIIGASYVWSPLLVTSSPVTLTKSRHDVLCLSGAGTLNLPAATGDGRSIVITNFSGGTVTLAPNGSDTIRNTATTIANGDTVMLTDYPVSSDEWVRF